jgi:hypothetical protein
MKRVLILSVFMLSVVNLAASAVEPASPDSYRFGAFSLLDHRSTYGTSWFPEPLSADEMDVDRELRIDYFHAENHDSQADDLSAEVEWNFGLLTLELEAPYSRESESTFDPIEGRTLRETSDGVGNIELSARYPLFEYVDREHHWDYTLAGKIELALPSGSKISKDTEVVPAILNLVRIGEHFSIQASAGYSMLIGPEEGGTNTLETDVVFGWHIDHNELAIPHVLATIPIFELNNETSLSGESSGENALFGTVGARMNFEAIGPAQPRIGLGYVFPIDDGARQELDWGVIVSFAFEL